MTRFLFGLAVLWSSAALAAPLVVETDPLTPEQQREKFHLPPGFEIQLVVSNPDIGQPMNLAFDAAGRLWVTHSVEYPYPVEEPGVEPRDGRFQGMGKPPARDKVTILSDFGPDGKARQVQHFATGLNIPIGVLPLVIENRPGIEDRETKNEEKDTSSQRSSLTSRSSLLDPGSASTSAIVFSIPNLYLLTDTDGDLVADEKKVLYGPFGNLDTHGMVNSLTRHLDGWVYANHGFRNTSKVKGTDGHEITMNSGNTFRFKIDGSRIEQVTWGQVNPFGMTVDRWGNFYNADCHSMPLTCLIPGAYYESFGKPHDGLGFGPKMIDHGHGSTGICGVAWYEAPQFPKDYHDCIFLCNPVNGIVHRDRIVFHGSSPWAETQSEFITCDDGWFRPVDVKLGPDGALYIADFYNAVIGHYEVPLDNPRRDREKGRIWRVVWKGEEVRGEGLEVRGKESQPSEPPQLSQTSYDLTALSNEQLIEKLGDPNIITRNLATNLLVDREDVDQASVLESTFNPTPNLAGVHSVWIAVRKPWPISENLLKAVANSSGGDPEITKIHLVMAVREVDASNQTTRDTFQGLLGRMLRDDSPRVRRAALQVMSQETNWLDREEVWSDESRVMRGQFNENESLRRACAFSYLEAMLEEYINQKETVEQTKDTHLLHALKLANRNLLFERVNDGSESSNPISGGPPNWLTLSLRIPVISELVLGLRTNSGARIALFCLSPTLPYHKAGDLVNKTVNMPESRRLDLMHLVARYGTKQEIEYLIPRLYRNQSSASAAIPELLAIRNGLVEQGRSTAPLNPWAEQLTEELLESEGTKRLGWTYSPIATGSNPDSCFTVQQRSSADGNPDANFFSTLPSGEQRTGSYRSDAFELPASLSFYFAGHNGFPDKPLAETSYVRLVNAETGSEITRTYPPRNDLAQLITWDLSTSADQRGYVEIVDGDTANAYAWLAVGRFSMEALNPQEASPVRQAVELIASLKLTEMEPKLHEIMLDSQQGMSTRLAAAEAYLQLHPDARKLALQAVARTSPVSTLQEGCLIAIEGHDETLTQKLLTDTMKAATGPVQGQLARVLFNDPAGGQELLRLVETGTASARLLTQQDIVDRLKSLGIENLDERLQALTKDLPPLSEQTALLIQGRKAAFDASADSSEMLAAGAAVFKTNCAACHQFKGEGNKIGPQLDGVGNRGADRLLEDILDPNRNVDGAFKTTVIALSDGRVLTGLKRRDEGATIIFANSEGKEFSVNTADIDEQKQSSLSLMPTTLGEKLTEQETSALLRYLIRGNLEPAEQK